ncbi:alpha/beta hydrolase [Novosphingobium colocasiae]|uniref:alpha/beta hydrolase n=1 Tax=Novosphingobium colocasiae TaxID=1256513 RepID=UPI0035AE0208
MDDHSPDPLQELYAGWVARTTARPDMPLEDVRALFEHWGDVTAEPRGIDYVEDAIGGLPALWVLPKGADDTRVLLCFHGGGYVLGSMYSHRKLYGHFAKAAGCRALIVDYRRAPENLHPGPVNDCAAAYHGLLETGIAPSRVAFVGDSAGGALAITTLLRARELGLPLPGRVLAMAPYLDLEATGETYDTNAAVDALGARAATLAFVDVFMGPEGDRHDPLASPLYADLSGLPPLLIQTGGDDVLLDDSRRFHALARAAGVDATLEVSPGQQHVFHFLAGVSPVADAAIARAGEWLKK